MQSLHDALLGREIDPVSVLIRLALLRKQGGTDDFDVLVDERNYCLLDEQNKYLTE